MASASIKTDLMLFVHGLSGSGDGTWSKMIELFLRDELYSKYEIDTYEYPTSKMRLPFGKRMPGIPELAEGLASYIDTRHSDKNKVVLIGHSLGGLVLRHYIVDEFKKSKNNNIHAAVMIATPHTGADLARFGRALSWAHAHLKQLAKGEDLLRSILADWGALDIESSICSLYVAGGIDAIVDRSSSMPYYSGVNFKNLINYGHLDVIKPDSAEDMRFQVVRKFVAELDLPKKPEAGQPNSDGWPLFFRYEKKCERFYHIRQIDEVIEKTLSGSNVWLSGPAGVGKTVALTRAIFNKGWEIHYFALDAFHELSALELIKEVCRQLMDHLGLSGESIDKSVSQAEIIRCFASALSLIDGDKKIAILIEEIPICSHGEYANFLDLAYRLSMIQDSFRSGLEVIWVFSSIVDPIDYSKHANIKLRERFAFLKAGVWDVSELRSLFCIINRELYLELTDPEVDAILEASENSPRNLKMLLKARCTEVGSKKSVADLISSLAVVPGND